MPPLLIYVPAWLVRTWKSAFYEDAWLIVQGQQQAEYLGAVISACIQVQQGFPSSKVSPLRQAIVNFPP